MTSNDVVLIHCPHCHTYRNAAVFDACPGCAPDPATTIIGIDRQIDPKPLNARMAAFALWWLPIDLGMIAAGGWYAARGRFAAAAAFFLIGAAALIFAAITELKVGTFERFTK